MPEDLKNTEMEKPKSSEQESEPEEEKLSEFRKEGINEKDEIFKEIAESKDVSGKMIRVGYVACVGRPNVGK